MSNFENVLSNTSTPEEVLAAMMEMQEAMSPNVGLAANADQIWVLICGFLVFWMHAGFSMLEAGSVQHKNAVNIMFKNMSTIGIGAVFYYLLGYAFAYGTDNLGSGSYAFIGTGNYALSQEDVESTTRHSWFFQFAFAATAATIVSGAVAGRILLSGYFMTAIFLTSFVYPVVSHWIWATDGWLSAFRDSDDYETVLSGSGGCGMVDFAGSGVVHLTGGVAAFWGAKILGPRLGRFDSDGTPNSTIVPHSISLQTLGVFILWFGWYGFNCGSTLAFAGGVASKVAVTTTLSAGSAVCTAIVVGRLTKGYFDIGIALNSALAGLVSITAGCPAVEDFSAIFIGMIGAVVYIYSSKLMLKIGVDDPVDAVAVHGFCGIWGVLAVGIFSTPAFLNESYGGCDWTGNTSGVQFATQLIGVIVIILWVTALMVPFFMLLKMTGNLRVPAEFEDAGLDHSEHGGTKFTVTGEGVTEAKAAEGTATQQEEITKA